MTCWACSSVVLGGARMQRQLAKVTSTPCSTSVGMSTAFCPLGRGHTERPQLAGLYLREVLLNVGDACRHLTAEECR